MLGLIAVLFAVMLIIVYIMVIAMLAEIILFGWFRVAPTVPSGGKMRDAVALEIRQNFPDGRTIIDVGSGLGGMAVFLGRRFPKSNVIGIELKPLPFCFARISSFLRGPKNCRFIFGDAARFVKDKKFDIAVCYSGPKLMQAIEPHKNKFKAVLSIDFPLPNTKPSRTTVLHKDRLGQHKLYVYETGVPC
jgi:SAM-dependent methyltransferase